MQGETILEELREIENVTDINGCFLLRAIDNAIIESTIPLKIHDDILWEIAVLRDTFQQFATGIKQGTLKDITLEGERGYIFIHNLPPHFILLAMGPKQINLAYEQLGMIDIINRINNKLKITSETLLAAPPKVFAVVGEKEAIPAYSDGGKATTSRGIPIFSSTVSAARAAAEARAAATESKTRELITPKPLMIKTSEPVRVATPDTTAVIPEVPSAQPPIETLPAVVEAAGSTDIPTLMQSIKDKGTKQKYEILRNVFETLKIQIKTMTGSILSGILDTLKDIILDQCGTSLALFDISRNSREFKNIKGTLVPQQVLLLRDRIDNWAQRIIK